MHNLQSRLSEKADDTIRSSVNTHLDKKHFWPDPLLQRDTRRYESATIRCVPRVRTQPEKRDLWRYYGVRNKKGS